MVILSFEAVILRFEAVILSESEESITKIWRLNGK